MNIAIYCGKNLGPAVDATNLEKGNPGVGGTQYVMLLLAHYLSQDPKYNVSVLSVRPYFLGGGGKFVPISGDSEVVDACERLRTDILIIRDHSAVIRRDIARSHLKVVYWSHNYVYADFCRFVARTPQIKCNVFVGKQQYDRYIDNDVIRKSVTIFNPINDSCDVPRSDDGRTVVYVGALAAVKGFCELCRIWPGIVKKVPGARLLVIGSGQLYEQTKLGKYGIAEEHYEKQFIPFITDSEGKIIPSVEFLGILGDEKTDVFLNSSVGVVNLSRNSETFGMVIVEMATAGLPVVTIRKNGHFDTVVDGKTGVLCSSLTDVQRNIIELLQSPERNERYGRNAKKFIRKFSPEIIVPQWKALLDAVYADDLKIACCEPSAPFSSDLKWLRCLLRFVRFRLGLSFVPSLTDLEYVVIKCRGLLINKWR